MTSTSQRPPVAEVLTAPPLPPRSRVGFTGRPHLLGLTRGPSPGGGLPTAERHRRPTHDHPGDSPGRFLTTTEPMHPRSSNATSPNSWASPPWSRRAVAELIRKEVGIDLAGGRRRHLAGATPRASPQTAGSGEVRQWLEETYPALRAGRGGGGGHPGVTGGRHTTPVGRALRAPDA
jgi:hypothetical protein